MSACLYCAAGNKPAKGWHILETFEGHVVHEVWCRAQLASEPKSKPPSIAAMTDAELLELYDAVSREITQRDIRLNEEQPQEQLGYTTLDPMENAN